MQSIRMAEPARKGLKLNDVHRLGEKELQPAEDISPEDLPLLANVKEVRIHHYLMNLATNFDEKKITGSAIIFFEWLTSLDSPKIILDAYAINVKKVFLLEAAQDFNVQENLKAFDASGERKNYYKTLNYQDWFAADPKNLDELKFTETTWSLVIHSWKKFQAVVVRIDYETVESSPSIHWRPCSGFSYESEDCKKCAYTPAPAINNRGLFPCHDAPSAFATWEVLLTTKSEYIPLLTSDEPGCVVDTGQNTTTHYFYTSTPLPMSTFAMVIGEYFYHKDLVPQEGFPILNDIKREKDTTHCSSHLPYPCCFSDSEHVSQNVVPIRLFSLDPINSTSAQWEKISNFAYSCLKSCREFVGPHPYSRLDLVIMPKCFPHMGLANPSMSFLSASNFTGSDEPLYVYRLPHEICHSWFGLLIGAMDWTEEWLSEGFATYYEDIVFEDTFQCYFPNKPIAEVKKEQALKICLRFILLQNELKNTDSELHLMSRGAKDQDAQAAKHGLVPVKQFMKVHYYKGYLLLWHLTFLVGKENFLKFMKEYIWRYHGQLVSSEIFLNNFCQEFKEILKVDNVATWTVAVEKDWLTSSKLPLPFGTLNLITAKPAQLREVPLFKYALTYLDKIKLLFRNLKLKKASLDELEGLSSTELLILLELVLSQADHIDVVRTCYQQFVNSTIFLQTGSQNPEIIHRWCELIILCKDEARLPVVQQFLERNIAMGVYLYGELIITEQPAFQQLARNIYHKLEAIYDTATTKVLKDMLF